MKIKISPESIIEKCPNCGSDKVLGTHKETANKDTGEIIKEDKTTKYICIDCSHKWWRKRRKFKKQNKGGAVRKEVEK